MNQQVERKSFQRKSSLLGMPLGYFHDKCCAFEKGSNDDKCLSSNKRRMRTQNYYISTIKFSFHGKQPFGIEIRQQEVNGEENKFSQGLTVEKQSFYLPSVA